MMDDKDIFEKLKYKFSCDVFQTGSRAICNPPPQDTDDDYLVYQDIPFANQDGDIESFLDKNGFKSETEEYEGDETLFSSWRRGKLNIILTTDHGFAQKHIAATKVCRELNLLEKSQRIMVFQAVLYGEFITSIDEGENR